MSDSEDESPRYRVVRRVGEGTYAVVYEAEDVQTGRRVAVKRVKMMKECAGLDISAVRELSALRLLQHANIVPLLDVYAGKRSLCLVLPFLDADLEQLIRDRRTVPVFDPADIKAWMLMLLRGLAHMHAAGLVHRDIKPSNLLLDASDGSLRLADLGLARALPGALTPTRPMTPQVCTRWYRSPELLLGSRHYGPGTDVWAAGCVFAEMLLRTPFLPGDTDVGQAALIARALGHVPSPSEWPGLAELPGAALYAPECAPPGPALTTRQALAGTFPAASDDALDLLAAMLSYDPRVRVSAAGALAMPYFARESRPMATPPHLLPRPSRDVLDNARRAADAETVSRIAPRRLVFD